MMKTMTLLPRKMCISITFAYTRLKTSVVSCYCCCNITAATAAAKSFQSCPILCDPIDGNPPGSSIPGILQARTLERVAMSFSNA